MSNLLSGIAVRLAYGATQLPRVAWYVGHGLAMRRLAEAARQRDGATDRGRRQTNVHFPIARKFTGTWPLFSGRTSPT